MPHRKLTRALLAAASSFLLVAGARAEIPDCDGRVIDVAARKPRAENAVAPDVYIAVKERSKVQPADMFKVYRPGSVGEENPAEYPLKIYVGRLQIIDLQDEVVVGRMIEFAPRREHPRVRYETVMVGDCLVFEPPSERAKLAPARPAPETIEVAPTQVTGEGERPMERRIIPTKILFKFDSSKIEDQWSDELAGLARFIAGEQPVKVVVEGHADWTGPDEYNVKLSRRRARAVVDYLATRHGLDRNLFEIKAYGESRPEVSNATREGRRRNRRAATLILFKAIPTVEASEAIPTEWPLAVEPEALIPDSTEIPAIPKEPQPSPPLTDQPE